MTPLGKTPAEVWGRIRAGDCAAAAPAGFDAGAFACPVCAEVKNFDPQHFVPEAKLVRLMNRDAQLAVAAAHLALQDAGVNVGGSHQPEEVALFGATGLAGLPLREVEPLLSASMGTNGRFELKRFGTAGLKAVNPILSFKILSNMPVCFVSICENLQGPNGIYTPWEGQGAQALEAGLRAVRSGDAPCALVGGCDVKTHELAFVSLDQQGLFRSWKETGQGVIPGEGAAFLVLEREADAITRDARIYARLVDCSFRTRRKGQARIDVMSEVYEKLGRNATQGSDPVSNGNRISAVLASDNGDAGAESMDERVLAKMSIQAGELFHPKRQLGDLFAAAAATQVALGALAARQCGGRVVANCFGHGSEQAAFVLEAPALGL